MKIYRIDEPIDWSKVRWEPLSPEEEKEALALARAAFTAEDLQKYTELDEGVPADEVIAELEEVQRQVDERTS